MYQATKHVEILQTQYIDKVDQVTKHVETPQTQFFDQGVGVPIVIQRQAPQIQTVLKTVKAWPVLFLPVVMQLQVCQILDGGEDGGSLASAVQRQKCGRACDPAVDAATGPSASDCGEGGGSLALAVHRQICGPPQERIWCIFEDACYDTKSLPQPDGVAGALAWLTSRPARVDQPPVRHTRHGFRLRWEHEASSQRR